MNEQMVLFQVTDNLETIVRPAEPGQLYLPRGVFREPPTASKKAMTDIYRSNLAHALFQFYNGKKDPIAIKKPVLSGQSCNALARKIVADGQYNEAMAQLTRTDRDNASKERVQQYLTQYAQAVHSTATTNRGQMVYLDIHAVFLSERPQRSGSLLNEQEIQEYSDKMKKLV